MIYSKIVGTGRYLPEKILTNFDLEKMVDTTDEWIRTRTGVERRHAVAPDQTPSDMCVEAAKIAIEDAGIEPGDIDFVAIGTTTPDLIFPNIATLVQHRLGIPSCPAIGMEAACTSFIYALTTVDKFIKAGEVKCALVIGAECITKLVDWKDRNTCVLFGDGAGAVILQSDDETGILSSHLHADGSYENLLTVPYGVSTGASQILEGSGGITMRGNEVFKMAVNTLGRIVDETLEYNNMKKSDIDWLVPHQANIRIINATARKLSMSLDHVVVTVDKHGNTSAASVPLALDVAVRDGRIKKGETLMLEAFGGGFTWGSVLLKF